jgi:GrpB-like predicted nucleotidyltransferase (UPF0157 family)
MLGLPYDIVKLVPYDPDWKKQYNDEAEKIERAC